MLLLLLALLRMLLLLGRTENLLPLRTAVWNLTVGDGTSHERRLLADETRRSRSSGVDSTKRSGRRRSRSDEDDGWRSLWRFLRCSFGGEEMAVVGSEKLVIVVGEEGRSDSDVSAEQTREESGMKSARVRRDATTFDEVD